MTDTALGSLAGPQRQVRRVSHLAADMDTPVVIVGGGACGLSAALTLFDLGIECVVLERDAFPSGSTALSAGLIPAAGTRAQKAIGVLDDSTEIFAQDIMSKTHGRAPAALVQAYTEAITPALESLETRHGIPFTVAQGFLLPGHSKLRLHFTGQMTGAALMAALQAAAAAAGIPVITQALVDTLWFDEHDRALGVSYQRPHGQVETLGCQALLLACNGFGGNPALVRQLLPEMADATFGGHVGNDGSAILWGEQLHARMRDLGAYQGHASWIIPQGALMSWSAIMEGAIQVNQLGQRFHDETLGYSEAAVQVLNQPGRLAWNVFDQPLLDLVRGFPEFRDAEALGAVHRCETVTELATLIGCQEAALHATLQSLAQPGPQPDGRVFKRLLQLPLYAVKVTGALFHTQGGLDISPDMRILHQDGTPFPNCLAAGGAAGGVSGDAVWGYVGGNGLLSAVAGGYLAAQTVRQLLPANSATAS